VEKELADVIDVHHAHDSFWCLPSIMDGAYANDAVQSTTR
jgi:hypothetical protein